MNWVSMTNGDLMNIAFSQKLILFTNPFPANSTCFQSWLQGIPQE
jgi:hypothetical protein